MQNMLLSGGFKQNKISRVTMSTPKNPFRLNVGFIVAEANGYSREIPVDFPEVRFLDLDLRQVTGTITFTRTAQGLLSQVRLKAQTTTECMRCLEPIELRLTPQFTELYAFSRNSASDVELVIPDTGQIDLGPLVREYMLLEMPLKPLCKQDCKGLCPVCGENQNETTCNHEDDDFDPRFSALKALFDQEDEPTLS
jgi:uncharacterized protein